MADPFDFSHAESGLAGFPPNVEQITVEHESFATLSTRHARLAAMAKLPRRSRTQTRIRRTLIAAGKPLTTIELAKRIYRTTRLECWHAYSTRRAAVRVARPLYRRRSRGMPIVCLIMPVLACFCVLVRDRNRPGKTWGRPMSNELLARMRPIFRDNRCIGHTLRHAKGFDGITH